MGFTQEKGINLDNNSVCLGCDEHCELGISYYFNDEDFKQMACPTIDGKQIKKYYKKDGRLQKTEIYIDPLSIEIPQTVINKAREIATLCDKYKTR